jgi:hypothetical protein
VYLHFLPLLNCDLRDLTSQPADHHAPPVQKHWRSITKIRFNSHEMQHCLCYWMQLSRAMSIIKIRNADQARTYAIGNNGHKNTGIVFITAW